MRQPIKVIIEVSGGVVQAVYAGSPADRLIEAVVVDHDNTSVGESFPVQPLTEFGFGETRAYDGGFPESWRGLIPAGT